MANVRDETEAEGGGMEVMNGLTVNSYFSEDVTNVEPSLETPSSIVLAFTT